MNHNDQEIRKISLLGKTYVTNISSQCCQKNKDCLNLFSNLSIRFCEPQRDPNAEEPCLDGSSFQHSNSGWFSSIFDRHNPGVVQVALFVDKSRGEISDDVDRIFTHELGHACSYIKRKVAINNGNKIVSADLDRYMSADPVVACDASYVGTSAMFDGLYRDLGLSIKSSQCLLSLASKKARFVDRPCENACPRVQLEEAFGNVSEYLFYPDKFVIPYILPNDLVNSYRDSQHPLAADVFKCMVQTPSLLTKYENLTGCKK